MIIVIVANDYYYYQYQWSRWSKYLSNIVDYCDKFSVF